MISQGANYSQIHVIGFCLGAHVAGKTGATVAGTLPRITVIQPYTLLVLLSTLPNTGNVFSMMFQSKGLDPAFSGFTIENTDERLDTSDARFVDVIHTNGGGFDFSISIGLVELILLMEDYLNQYIKGLFFVL